MTALDANLFIIFLVILVIGLDAYGSVCRGLIALAICSVFAAIPTLIFHALVEIIR